MKNKGVTILSIITNIILISMLCSFIKINGSIIKEKQIIKEMSESTQVTDLNNQINALNTEHTEYMNYIQTCKAQLASAITDMGIETSESASLDTMASNIRSISGGSFEYIDGGINRQSTTTAVASISKSYTAESKCTLLIYCSITYTKSMSESIKLNQTVISPSFTKSSTGTYISLYNIPIEKGDSIELSLSATNTANYSITTSYFMAIVK